MVIMYIFICLIIFALIYSFYTYNKIVALKQDVNEAWSDIDVQLKRRQDLIPNLITIVGAYANYEKDLFENITNLRTHAEELESNNILGKEEIEKSIETGLQSVMAVAEAYPDLKANEEFLHLQEELSKTENEIARFRKIYNTNVAIYNTLIGVFPSSMIAGVCNFNSSTYFQNTAQ